MQSYFTLLSAKAYETLILHGRSSDLLLFLNQPSQAFFRSVAKERFIEKSLQQRDCSGFSPDSLLIFFSNEKNEPLHGGKDTTF